MAIKISIPANKNTSPNKLANMVKTTPKAEKSATYETKTNEKFKKNMSIYDVNVKNLENENKFSIAQKNDNTLKNTIKNSEKLSSKINNFLNNE